VSFITPLCERSNIANLHLNTLNAPAMVSSTSAGQRFLAESTFSGAPPSAVGCVVSFGVLNRALWQTQKRANRALYGRAHQGSEHDSEAQEARDRIESKNRQVEGNPSQGPA